MSSKNDVNEHSCASDCSHDFLLLRFNPRRALRGAPAAEVETPFGLLWMSRSDIRKNLREFGDHPELWKAYEAYDKCVEYPPR